MLCRTAHRKPYWIWNVLNCDNFGRDGETQHFGRENPPPPQEMSRKNAVLRVRACVNSTVSFTCWRQKLSGYVWCLSQNSDTICGLQLHVCAVYLKQHSNSTSTEWCVGTFIKRHWHGTDGQISINQSGLVGDVAVPVSARQAVLFWALRSPDARPRLNWRRSSSTVLSQVPWGRRYAGL